MTGLQANWPYDQKLLNGFVRDLSLTKGKLKGFLGHAHASMS